MDIRRETKILEFLPFPLFIENREEKIVFANRSFLELVASLSQEQLLSQTWRDFVFPQDIHLIEERRREREKKSISVFTHLLSARGNLPVKIIFSPLFEGKVFQGVIATIFPTEKETRLKIENEFYEEMVESSIDGIVVMENGKIIFHNRRLAEMTGFTTTELLSSPLAKIVSEASLSQIQTIITNPNSILFPLHYEIELLTKSKKRLDCELRVCPIKKGGVKLILYFRDISLLKEAERNKTDIFGKISHEILNPLSTIKETITILQEKASERLEPVHKKFLTLAAEEVMRLKRIADNLIDVSRIARGKTPLNIREVKFEEIVDKALNSLQLFIQKQGVEVVKEIPTPLPPFLADPDRLSSIVINLLDNAIKFSPERGKIIIKAVCLPPDDPIIQGRNLPLTDNYLLVSVTDSGPGIDEESRERIFERFERGKSAVGIKGIGLGLAIVKEFIGLARGDIWVESSLGVGSTFTFVLPLFKKKEEL